LTRLVAPPTVPATIKNREDDAVLYAATYLSRSLIPAIGPEMIGLAGACMRNNQRLDVTGALYYDDRHFFQTLEGPEPAIAVLLERIRRDPRHADMRILARGPILARRFPCWSMKFVDGAWLKDAAARFEAERLRLADGAEIEDRVAELAAA
jgi:hypothetical protein